MKLGRAAIAKRLRRAAFVVVAVSPLGVVGVASCILADPPPALPNYIEQNPQIDIDSVSPPVGSVSGFPADNGAITFSVPVLLFARTYFFVFENAHTSISKVVAPLPPESPSVDGGGYQIISFQYVPSDRFTCQTITFYADADGTNPFHAQTSDFLTCTTYCTSVSWTYDPTGGGGCPTSDAGRVPDADLFRDSPSEANDAPPDLIIHINPEASSG
jgi:hypothetical protein